MKSPEVKSSLSIRGLYLVVCSEDFSVKETPLAFHYYFCVWLLILSIGIVGGVVFFGGSKNTGKLLCLGLTRSKLLILGCLCSSPHRLVWQR